MQQLRTVDEDEVLIVDVGPDPTPAIVSLQPLDGPARSGGVRLSRSEIRTLIAFLGTLL